MIAVAERLEEIPDILNRIRHGNRVDHYETKRRAKDGRIISISLTVSPIRDASGMIIGASKVARDITDQKRSEEELKRLLLSEKEMRQTAELLNQISPILASELNIQELAQTITDVATRLTGAHSALFFIM